MWRPRHARKKSVLLFRNLPDTSHARLPAMSTTTVHRPLSEKIKEALVSNPHVPSHVRVDASEGRVVLSGSVRSFFQKQMAQEAIRRIDGVETIENLLEVNWA